ncbi:MAG: hypothetical protein HEQ35_04975 [Gloeotrichia echinulata IR180]|jgi:hypothetical protein|nr:hypothetical protein [Gloeotrichia echinulata DEX184]
MTGHHKFSQLTQDFSPARKAKIAAKKAQLKEEMALDELREIEIVARFDDGEVKINNFSELNP